MKTGEVSFVRMAGESAIQFVLRFLLERGMSVKVEVRGEAGEDDTVYDGFVHNLDWVKGSDHAFAWVTIPELDDAEDLKVGIYLDGRVIVLPDEAQGS